MKTIAALLVTVALTPTDRLEAPPPSVCFDIANAAEASMESRQLGIPIELQLHMAGDNDLLVGIVLNAYTQPIMPTMEMREIAVEAYGQIWFDLCVETATD